MHLYLSRSQFRLIWAFCLCTALWFALGGTIKVLFASGAGKTIEMVVCSGSGVKKIYMPISSSADAGHEVSVKHCSNTPLALVREPFDTLKHLAYALPSMHAKWQLIDEAQVVTDRSHNGKPPPGRAPPRSLSA
jgi:hypothetical protein